MPDLKTKIFACAVLAEELRPEVPDGIEFEKLDFGLHQSPERLNNELQERINQSGDYENIVLAYGLCGMAVVGLKSETSTLIVPKVDDCISIFLGSREAYLQQQLDYPGSYFLSKGWIEGQIDGLSPTVKELQRLVEKYGVERARRIYSVFEASRPLRHYKRMAFISTSDNGDIEEYRKVARERAVEQNLQYDEIRGTTDFLRKIALGDWDDDFLVVPPGHTISFDDFRMVR
jgi:hypothetical protein